MPFVFIGQRACILGKYFVKKQKDVFYNTIFISKHYNTLFEIYNLCVTQNHIPPILLYWNESKEKFIKNTVEYYSGIVPQYDFDNVIKNVLETSIENSLNYIRIAIKNVEANLQPKNELKPIWIIDCTPRNFLNVFILAYSIIVEKTFPFPDLRLHFVFDPSESLIGVLFPLIKFCNHSGFKNSFVSNSKFYTSINDFRVYCYPLLRSFLLMSLLEYANSAISLAILMTTNNVEAILFIASDEYIDDMKSLNKYRNKSSSMSIGSESFLIAPLEECVGPILEDLVKKDNEIISAATNVIVSGTYTKLGKPKYIATIVAVENKFSSNLTNKSITNIETILKTTRKLLAKLSVLTNTGSKIKVDYQYLAIPYTDSLERYLLDIRKMLINARWNIVGDECDEAKINIHILNSYYDEKKHTYIPENKDYLPGGKRSYNNAIIYIAPSIIENEYIQKLVEQIDKQFSITYSSINKNFDIKKLKKCCDVLLSLVK